jgi:uncharacterized protein YbjT (DUF2867 family)
MKILLTGATGYIGKRLLPFLLEEGHEVYCCTRDKRRFSPPPHENGQVHAVEVDYLESTQLPDDAPEEIDAAYYLMHSMSSSVNKFESLEEKVARNFLKSLQDRPVQQIIYLSGMVNAEELSTHLKSRLKVERILDDSPIPLTVLRAGIIVGSGSASFEIIRDLVEKLPVMVAPKWVNTRSQPIAIRDVIELLKGVLGREDCYDEHYDIGGPDILTYKEMLLKYAEVRNLKRYILTVPVLTPRLSSYWLYFVTSTSYPLAVNLVNSMKVDVVCNDQRLQAKLGQDPIPYKEAVQLAFQKIRQNLVASSWKDAAVSSKTKLDLDQFVEVPEYGCFKDEQTMSIPADRREEVLRNIWSIGGDRGWYYGNILWRIRGYLDKIAGGVGLRRGRTSPTDIEPGDALDFWRVLAANKEKGRLLLYAEMRLPGQAWLEFNIPPAENDQSKIEITQVATFRPSGLWGRIYWYILWPFHVFIFKGMLQNIIRFKSNSRG